MIIRAERPGDVDAVQALVQAAFGQVEEAEVVERLRDDPDLIISLVADIERQVIGHIMFSRLGSSAGLELAQLSPLSVAPSRQRSGVGAALIEAGLGICRVLGLDAVLVLGHPDYYPRFGFTAEATRALVSPFAGRPAFMALALKPGLELVGEVNFAKAFDGL
jgi:putative acetyltransferase